jgi:hypothetical protein
MKKVTIQMIMIVMLVTLACPLPAYSTSHPLAHPSWDIIAVPETLYIRPPGCEASFMIYVTDYYKTKPIKIWIEVSTATIMGREFPYPSGFTTQPDYTELWEGKMPDWQATVTVHASSPWELPEGDYPLKI